MTVSVFVNIGTGGPKMTTVVEDIEEQMEEGEDEPLGSDSSPDEEDARNAEEIARLEKALAEDKFSYNLHLQLIALLREGDDLDKLRAARETMADLFPLTPKLWLEWIRSEANLCLDDEEKIKVLDLFQRGVKDYTSVELWLEYCQFTIGLMGGQGGMERIRSVFEEACRNVGLHVTKGAFIFEAYREFEIAIYSTMQGESDVCEADVKRTEEIEKQRRRILSLFRRQLSVPLLDMEKTLAEFKEFCGDDIDEAILLRYNKALKKLETILPFEEELMKVEEPKFADYEPYLDFELAQGEGARIQALFERAILDDCLSSALWDKYLKYLDFTLKIDAIAVPVHERSLRNCPWASCLWVAYLTCIERLQFAPAKIQSVVDDAFQVGFSTGADYLAIWMFQISWHRRQINLKEPQADIVAKLRNCFDKAREHLSEFTGEDCVSPILQYWAKIEVKLGNLTRAREIWNLVTRQGAASDAQTWLNYANFERAFGDEKHYRRVLQRGMYAATDWPESLGELWVQFELEEGSLEGFLDAQAKYDARMNVINKNRQRAAAKMALKVSTGENGHPSSKTASSPLKRDKKRRAQKGESPAEDKKKGKWEALDKDGFKMPCPVNDSTSSSSQDLGKIHGVAPPGHDPLKHAQTVFLSNLAYEINNDTVLEFFKNVGEVDELRLVRDYKKRCKGFGYLVFKNIHSVTEALKKDRFPIDGRPVFISRLNERKQFTYPIKLEKNKLFVKNIPLDATKEELQSLFETCGSVTDVRLCTLRNGKFKGIAYVDYKDETAASAAVVKYDGFELRNKMLSVAISNPPSRRPEQEQSQQASSAPKGSTMKTRLFVPRALQVKCVVAKPSAAPSSLSHKISEKPRSNADFRNLVLKQ
ncbi:squamous cell carcinoma antigen recognized by T-cells 3-like [Tropilaelaps mercedesae]|uniref:Squamous cell carcinoma antigen recognized by T-cells 3-like n=1 Tax=Tropilaelaps mercedesae TaxID=418985 RepID=A0A1V9X9X2_9ACAR|nr:squamous cell carcinoma antigen recognized by T-cells 3-like [Tropilaelaps mercedesae]